MADNDNLLASLTDSRLPALPESRQPASDPQDPGESSREVETRGRAPDEVVPAREERPVESAPSEIEEASIPAAKKKGKESPKTYEIEGQRYTVAELEAAGLLEKVIQTARQFPALQKKYVEKLEEEKAVPARPAETAPAPAQPRAITNQDIARVYDAIAKEQIQQLIADNLLESDLHELYPRGLETMAGQLRYAFDKIFEMGTLLNTVSERLEQTISYLNKNRELTEGQITAAKYNKHLDDLVAIDPKLYGGLKDKETRKAFTVFLAEEVGANQDQTTGEKAPNFLAKQWVAFNAQTIMDAAKTNTDTKKKQVDKRFVAGEGSGPRPGTPDLGEKPMLDRMIESSGRLQH